MTTQTLRRVPVEELSEQARQVRFSVVLVTAIGAFFVAIGWLIGHAWLSVVFCCVAVRYGMRVSGAVAWPQPEEDPGRGRRPDTSKM